MGELEIAGKLFEKAKETFLGKAESKCTEAADEFKKRKELDDYYVSVIDDITDDIVDEWEIENVAEYVGENAPIKVDANYSMFSDEMRQTFIEDFYKKSSLYYKSEKIETHLNRYLDKLEDYLCWDLKDKMFYQNFSNLSFGQKRIEQIVREILDNQTKDSDRQEELRKLSRVIKIRMTAFLNYYLNNQLEMYEDIEEAEYQEEISNIRSKFELTWKTNIIDLLNKGCKTKTDDFWEQIDFIKSEQEYEVVLETARQIYVNHQWDKKVDSKIKEEIKYPHFYKVCLISGDMGTGKTYFVRNFVKQNIQELDTIIVPISVSRLLKEGTIGDILLEACNIVLDVECPTFKAFCDLIKNFKYRICVIIEDIQNLYIENNERFIELIETIRQYTKYDCLNWLFTVNEYDFFIFEAVPHFLKRYCFGKNGKSQVFLDNSFSLNQYNHEKDIVSKILQKYNIEVIENDTVGEILNSDGIETPLYAHIFGKCCEGEEVLAYPESYFDYIKMIVDLFNKKIGRCVNAESLIQDQKKLLQIMRETSRTIYEENELKDINGESLKDLKIIQLLSYEQKKVDDIYSFEQYVPKREYKLRVDVFWAFKFILYCQSIAENKIESVKELLKFPQSFKEILIPCYLMYMDEKEDDTLAAIEELFLLGEGYYPLFCARKASLKFEKTVYEFLSQHPVDDNIKTVYALLYYINYSKLKIKQKLLLICRNAQKIIDCGLLDIYENVFRKIVSMMKDERNLKRNILELVPCKVSELNVINGYICGNRYKNVIHDSGKTFYHGINNLKLYIESKAEILKTIDIKEGNNSSFMDFFLRGYFEAYLKEKSLMELYNHLNDEGYFQLDAPMKHYFIRNFTCAAGNIYAQAVGRSAFCKEYEGLVNTLTESDSIYDNKTAWFLITNSLSEHRRGINNNLVHSFKRLWDNPKIGQRYRKHKEVKEILKYNNIDS